MTTNAAAEAIAEQCLYLAGKAIKEGDDALFLECTALPQIIETPRAIQFISTEEQVFKILANVRQYMTDNGCVDIVRTVVSAKFLDEDTVEATHVSSMLGAHGEQKRTPYPEHSILRRIDGSWRIISNIYAIIDNDDYITALSGGQSENDSTDY